MSAVGDARKRLAPPAYDEHADILAELAETQAALHAATNDVVRLAAALHTAHGQIDRVRALLIGAPMVPEAQVRRALDGGAS